MTPSRSRKVMFGLLAVGLSALVADRTLSVSTATIDAAIEDLTVTATGTDPATGKPAAATNGPVVLIPAKLNELAAKAISPGPVRDAFAPAGSWKVEPPAEIVTKCITTDDRPARFLTSHALKAVVQAGSGSQAWVDGQLIAIGQSLDSFVLVSVEPMTATFECDGKSVVLRLPDADVKRSEDVKP